jgi:hypothetical protein
MALLECDRRSRIVDEAGPKREKQLSILPLEDAARFQEPTAADRRRGRRSCFLFDADWNEDEDVGFRRSAGWNVPLIMWRGRNDW